MFLSIYSSVALSLTLSLTHLICDGGIGESHLSVSSLSSSYMYILIILSPVLYPGTTAFKTHELKRTLVTKRPLMGQTSFTNQRPLFVKNVTAHTCVCILCYGFRHLLKALLAFQHWEESCPRIHELISDVRTAAGEFSPSETSLLDVLLCPRDESTGHFKKDCSYGQCQVMCTTDIYIYIYIYIHALIIS